MDDTIEQMLKTWVVELNKSYGTSFAYEDVWSWNLTESFPGLTEEEIFGVTFRPGFWKKVEPMPGAGEALKRFMDEGHDVYLVTSTPCESVYEKMRDLIQRCFPFISWKQVIIAWNKKLIKGDVLIDDGVHNLEGAEYAKILMTAPHNKDYDAEGSGMIRVNNWEEAVAAVERIAAGIR